MPYKFFINFQYYRGTQVQAFEKVLLYYLPVGLLQHQVQFWDAHIFLHIQHTIF